MITNIVKLARGQQIRLARRCKKANRKYYVEYCPWGRYFIIRGNQVFRASEGAFLL